MVSDLLCHLTYNSKGAWYTLHAMLLLNYRIISEKLREIKTIEMCDFFRPLILSKIIEFSVCGLLIYILHFIYNYTLYLSKLFVLISIRIKL